MPITSDKANITIEFEWQAEHDPNLVLKVRYYIAGGGVPILAFSENGTDWYNLPYLFYKEVLAEVDSQLSGFRKTGPAPVVKKPLRTSVIPTGGGQVAVAMQEEAPQMGLPLPKNQRTMNEEGTLEPMEVADIDPLQSLSAVSAIADRVSATKPTSVKKQKQKQAEEEIINRPVIRGVDEATARMLRGGNSEKTIKPRHQL